MSCFGSLELFWGLFEALEAFSEAAFEPVRPSLRVHRFTGAVLCLPRRYFGLNWLPPGLRWIISGLSWGRLAVICGQLRATS